MEHKTPDRDGAETVSIDNGNERASARIAVPEIGRRLGIGRLAVYSMFEQRIIPGIRGVSGSLRATPTSTGSARAA
jgi:hypothetical protein